MYSESAKRILIVDDDASLRRLLNAILQEDYLVDQAASGEEALERLDRINPGVVLLDILMPGTDGHETCQRIKSRHRDIRVIMVSGLSSAAEQTRAFQSGADDYLVKPINSQDLRARVKLHFRFREAMHRSEKIRGEIESRNRQLRHRAEQNAQDIIAIQDVAVFTLARVAETRDQETGGHLVRIRAYAQTLGEELARSGPYKDEISRQFLDDLYRSSPLHDIGKVGIRDGILLKPGRLTPEEREEMQRHAIIGANILDQAVTLSRGGGFLAMAALIARFHHERFDGMGYPAGLVANEIPLAARIVALADVYDALTSVRPHKPAFPVEQARAIILQDSGRHFDPAVVDAFERRFDEFLRVQVKTVDDFTSPRSVMAYCEYDEILLNP